MSRASSRARSTPYRPAGLDLAVGAAAFVTTFAIQLPFVRHHAPLLDEGVILQMAADIGHGKVPYRDAVHYAFPGVFYLTAAVFEIFGPSVEAARILAASLFSVAVAALAMMSRWWCSRIETAFFVAFLLGYRVWAFPHWHMLNYSPMAVALALVAAWLVGEQLARPDRRWAVAGGIFAGLAIVTKQDSGGATAAALGIGLVILGHGGIRQRIRRALAFSAAVCAVVTSCLLAVWWAGYLEDLVREAIYGPLYGVANYNYLRRPDLFPLFAQDPHLRQNIFSYFPQILMAPYGARITASWIYTQTGLLDATVKLLYHLPWIVLLCGAVASARSLRQPASPAQQRRTLVVLLAAAFLLAFNPPRDWVHLLVLYPPTLLLLASTLPWLRTRRFARPLLALAILAFLLASSHLAIEFRHRQSQAVHTERGTFYTEPALADSFDQVLAAIGRTSPTTPLLALPYHPFLNFLADRPPLSRYLFLWPVEWNTGRDREIIEALRAHPEATVLYSLSQLLHLGSPREFAPELFGYLADNYAIGERYGAATPQLTFLRLRTARASHNGSLVPAIRERATVTKRKKNHASSETLSRREFLHFVTWPFRRAMTLETQPAAEVALRVPVVPRRGDRLITAFSTNPERWQDTFFPPVDFRLAVASAGAEDTLIQRAMRSGADRADRKWIDVSIDLSPWADQSIELIFAISTRWGTPPSSELGGWALPRIVAENADGADGAGAPPPIRGQTPPGAAAPSG